MTSYIKISQILKLKSKDITSKTLHAKFYASRIKYKRIRRGVKYTPRVWSVFKSPGKIGLTLFDIGFLCSFSAPMIMKFGTGINLDVFYTMVTKIFVNSLLLRNYDVITCILTTT